MPYCCNNALNMLRKCPNFTMHIVIIIIIIVIIIIIISFLKVDFYITFYNDKKPININLPIKLEKNSDTKLFADSLL